MQQNLAELLVRLRLHLLAMGGGVPPSSAADYQECTRLVDEALLATRATEAPAIPHGLTAREGQILGLLQHGYSNQAIAAQLGVTPGTVKTYLKSIYAKLGVKNRTQAALLMHRPPAAPIAG